MRIGNWFEEIRLKQDTGIRFYPDIKDKKGSLMTQSRCITHTEQTLPKDYSSNTRDTIVVPQKHADYRDKKTVQGPRASRMEEKIRSEIEKEYKARELNDFNETRKTNYATATKDSFGNNSFVPALRENDPTLRIPTRTSNYSTDPAITYYSHMVNQSDGHVSFPASFVGSTNPFKKSAAFSSDIVREQVSKRTETNERPKPLPTLLEFRCLNNFRERIVQAAQRHVGGVDGHSDGRGVRHLVDTLWNNQTSTEVITFNAFEDSVCGLFPGFSVSEEERRALLSAFDTRSDYNLSLSELTSFIRKTPSPRRLELIDIFYSLMDPQTTGAISVDNIRALVKPNKRLSAFMAAMSSTSSVSVDDFFDFYIDLSAEVSSDDLFEALLVETWNSQ